MALLLCMLLVGYALSFSNGSTLQHVGQSSHFQKKDIDLYPDCVDSIKINCTDVKHEVCNFESAYLICPRTCNICDHNHSYHPCIDHVAGIDCADLPDPCSDTVGKISCPLYCGLCQTPTTTPLPVTTPTSGPCDNYPCVNGGSCYASGRAAFTCVCPDGYSGPFCNIDPPSTPPSQTTTTTAASACAPNPCLNGGHCSDINGGFECLCSAQFFHPLCSKEPPSTTPPPTTPTTSALTTTTTAKTTAKTTTTTASVCAPNPCLNGGHCRNINGGFECLCSAQFFHPLCSKETAFPSTTPPPTTPTTPTTASYCSPNPCLNGGHCSDINGGFECLCSAQLFHPFCSKDPPSTTPQPTTPTTTTTTTATTAASACAPNPCLNGGHCSDVNGGFECLCSSQFFHPLCSKDPPSTTPPPTTPTTSALTTTSTTQPIPALFCVPNPCLNEGHCNTLPGGGFECLCSSGLFHPLCSKDPATTTTATAQTNQSNCASNPCQNGGHCSENSGGFECFCAAGFVHPVCAPECVPQPTDLIFLLDASQSEGRPHFQEQLTFVAGVVNGLDIGPDKIQIGLSTFETIEHKQFYLNDFYDKQAIMDQIVQTPYFGGPFTMTSEALKDARELMLLPANGRRLDAQAVVVVMTDGGTQQHGYTLYQADMLKQTGALVVTVGIGSDVDQAELTSIASGPEYQFNTTFGHFYELYQDIVKTTTTCHGN